MTADQLTPAQKAGASLVPGFFDDNGYGFGVGVVTRRRDLPAAGSYGWDGGLGSTWVNDPAEGMATILLTNRAYSSPAQPPVVTDFRTLAYAAIDD